MRFQIPQFIEVEDRIFGPLTLKQFVYLAGGAGFSFALYRFLPFIIALPLILVVAGLALALAFFKLNGRNFIAVMESAFHFFRSSRLYIWHKLPRAPSTKGIKMAEEAPLTVPRLSESKLKDLTWSLDIYEQMGPGTKETMEK
ncbi:MAG TPA: PrgI family protein [Candidatus Paceibacterota bacterium]